MGILGERYTGVYEGHAIELVHDNLSKTLKLVIDGATVASESRAKPHDITLEATFDHAGVTHRIVGRSRVVKLSTQDSIEIDGKALSLAKK